MAAADARCRYWMPTRSGIRVPEFRSGTTLAAYARPGQAARALRNGRGLQVGGAVALAFAASIAIGAAV